MAYRGGMQTTLHRDTDGRSVLTVSGEIDAAVADDLIAAGRSVLVAATVLRLDLSAVTFLDSSGLAALIGLRNACVESGADLTLVAPSRQVRRILEITGLAESFVVAG